MYDCRVRASIRDVIWDALEAEREGLTTREIAKRVGIPIDQARRNLRALHSQRMKLTVLEVRRTHHGPNGPQARKELLWRIAS